MDLLLSVMVLVAIVMMVWDCVEVGRNDAANLVNAVFGSRILRRRQAVLLAGIAVVLGATFASPVMETARKGIFDPGVFQGAPERVIAIYTSVYVVDTVLLYSFSAFGMPVSTTACLVFSLTGGAYALAGSEAVYWGKLRTVIAAIFMSIVIAGIASFLIQRAFRGAIRDRADDTETVLLHGPWVAGAMLTWLTWFMLLKGMTGLAVVEMLKDSLVGFGTTGALLMMWGSYTLVIHLLLAFTRGRMARHLFRAMAIVGTLCMAFAFGQNDLANCASPGLSSLWLWQNADQGVTAATEIQIPALALFACGFLIFLGMRTRNAQRVTRAQVNTGSQFDHVALYAPRWCLSAAKVVLRLRPPGRPLAPEHALTERGKKIHFDSLRASVIMSISASVIALASSFGLPVSTTYVTFAAVVFTGMADRVFVTGDAELKMARAIWVVTGWLIAAVVAFVAAGIVAWLIVYLGLLGLLLGLGANLTARHLAKRAADAQEARVHGQVQDADADDLGEPASREEPPPVPVETV